MTDLLLLLILIVVFLDFLRGTRVGEWFGYKVNRLIYKRRTKRRVE